MNSLLVTGGAGFIGANFVRYWRHKYPADCIVVLDALTYAGNRANIAGVEQIVFAQGNIGDLSLVKRLLAEHKIDTLVHFAAESHVDRSIHGPDAFIETNIVGTHALLKAAKAIWLDQGTGFPHRFHHVSTDEVFGSLEQDDPPFRETTPYQPNSPYSASKGASDHIVRAYNRTYGLQVSTSHCSNNYGAYQFPEKLIPLFVINSFLGKPLPVYGDGGNIRDWLHVEDHCRGIELILRNGRIGESYNIGGGVQLPNGFRVASYHVISSDDAGAIREASILANVKRSHHFQVRMGGEKGYSVLYRSEGAQTLHQISSWHLEGDRNRA